MRENILIHSRPKTPDVTRTPDPIRFEKTRGREIDLPTVEERFSMLQEGLDYSLAEINTSVYCDKPIEQFMLFVNPTRGTERRQVKPPHWRTVSTEHVKATVRQRQRPDALISHFYEANTKGVGFLKPSAEGIALDDYPTWKFKKDDTDTQTQTLGMVEASNLLRPKNIVTESQFLFEQGLRSEVYWGVAQLKRVPHRGEMRSMAELQRADILPTNDNPMCLAVRLLRNNDRIAEFDKSDERRREIIVKAFAIFNQENIDAQLGFPVLDVANPEHQKIFFQEFFRRTGRNLATMLNLGYVHFHMHSANVTMAAELVDIESMSNWRNPYYSDFLKDYSQQYNGVRLMHLKDMRDSVYGLKILLHGADRLGAQYGERAELVKILNDSFDAALKKNLQQSQQIDRAGAKLWLEWIVKAVLIKQKRLGPLNQLGDKQADVQEWLECIKGILLEEKG